MGASTKLNFLFRSEDRKKANSAMSEHKCLTNHTVGWDKYTIIPTNRHLPPAPLFGSLASQLRYAPLNRDDGGLLPDAYLHLVRKRGS